MIDSMLITVNEHCLDNVIRLSGSTMVAAEENVYSADGIRLIAKGSGITPAVKEMLLNRKLSKPLETSLCIEDCITVASIKSEAEQLLGTMPALKALMGDKQTSILETLSHISLHPAAALLLTVADKNREGAFRHGVLVALIAVALGTHQKQSRRDCIMLALAGLLHDIGKLYINPEYLHPYRTLKPDEWKHVAAHPHIGQVVLEELTDCPQIAINAVAAHHERLDGSGYPHHLSGLQISPLARILTMGETLSGIIVRNDDALIRSCLALKFMPDEHSHNLVAVVAALKRDYVDDPFLTGIAEGEINPKAHDVARTLAHALAECDEIALKQALPKVVANLVHYVRNRLAGLHQSLKATGIEECLALGYLTNLAPQDREILLEIEVIAQEIGWRLRDIARDLYLRISDFPSEIAAILSSLIEILDHPVHIPYPPAEPMAV